jgi:hypothetical protein
MITVGLLAGYFARSSKFQIFAKSSLEYGKVEPIKRSILNLAP